MPGKRNEGYIDEETLIEDNLRPSGACAWGMIAVLVIILFTAIGLAVYLVARG